MVGFDLWIFADLTKKHKVRTLIKMFIVFVMWFGICSFFVQLTIPDLVVLSITQKKKEERKKMTTTSGLGVLDYRVCFLIYKHCRFVPQKFNKIFLCGFNVCSSLWQFFETLIYMPWYFQPYSPQPYPRVWVILISEQVEIAWILLWSTILHCVDDRLREGDSSCLVEDWLRNDNKYTQIEELGRNNE